MKRVAIIGGETHIAEVTNLNGKAVEIVGASVREDQVEWAKEQFGCPIVTDYNALLADFSPDVVAIANENNLRAEAILACIEAGSTWCHEDEPPILVRASPPQEPMIFGCLNATNAGETPAPQSAATPL